MANIMISVFFLFYRENRRKEILRKDLSAKTELLYEFNNLISCIIATALINPKVNHQRCNCPGLGPKYPLQSLHVGKILKVYSPYRNRPKVAILQHFDNKKLRYCNNFDELLALHYYTPIHSLPMNGDFYAFL
jgi:hypothetical protein